MLNSKEGKAAERAASPPPTPLPPTSTPPTEATSSSAGFIQSIFNKLSAADGAQYVGRCPDLETLRQTLPSHEGQKIVLAGRESAPAGQKSVGGGELYALRNSELKDDDGIVFRVNADWCWQRPAQHNIDAQWFGVYNDGRACGDAFSRALDYVVAQGERYYCRSASLTSAPCARRSNGLTASRNSLSAVRGRIRLLPLIISTLPSVPTKKLGV